MTSNIELRRILLLSVSWFCDILGIATSTPIRAVLYKVLHVFGYHLSIPQGIRFQLGAPPPCWLAQMSAPYLAPRLILVPTVYGKPDCAEML